MADQEHDGSQESRVTRAVIVPDAARPLDKSLIVGEAPNRAAISFSIWEGGVLQGVVTMKAFDFAAMVEKIGEFELEVPDASEK
jgi:hypothetical protein